MLDFKPFPESFEYRNFLFVTELLYGIKSNALLTMDLLFQVEELVDIHKALHSRLGMVILLAFRDGIYKVSPYVDLISELE